MSRTEALLPVTTRNDSFLPEHEVILYSRRESVMFKRFKKLAAVAAVAVAAGLGWAQSAWAGVAPRTIALDTLLDGGANANGVTLGDKLYSNFNFSSGGDLVLDAADIDVIFAEEGAQQFVAFLMDLNALPGETSDVVVGYDVTVLDPSRHIRSVGLSFDGGPLDVASLRSSTSVIETVSTLDGSALLPGGTDDTAIISVFNNGDVPGPDNFETSLAINPARALRFTKDILVSARLDGEPVGITFVENSVTQNPGTVIPLPAAAWAAMPVFGAIVGGKRVRRLFGNRN
jgi:hypothetical protein